MRKFLTDLMMVILATGCSQVRPVGDPVPSDKLIIRTDAGQGTKTTIDGTTITWTKGDALGLFIGDIHENVYLSNAATPSLTSFEGGLLPKGTDPEEVKFHIYYPYRSSHEGNIIEAVLPSEQTAPFDPSANFMSAPAVSALYDEENLPSLSFNFDTQFFGILKLQVTNTKDDCTAQTIHRIDVTSTEGKTLCGDFTFDVTDPVNTIAFSEHSKSATVSSVFENSPVVGKDETHTVYVFVKPGSYTGMRIMIQMDDCYATFKTGGNVTVGRGDIVKLPVMDLARQGAVEKIKKVACWGDSFTHGNYAYPPILQSILGSEWMVYDGGISGDRTIEIAARQGAIKSYVQGSFCYPATGAVSIQGIYLEDSELTKDRDRPFRMTRWGKSTRLLNPCLIGGIESTLTYASITRLAPGESFPVEDGAQITTYGARFCRDADVTIIYMGTNGGYDHDYDLLVKQHQAMIDFTVNKEYIVFTYHYSKNEGYEAKMDAAFGAHVIHMRKAVVDRAVELLLKTGVYQAEEDISDADRGRINAGWWPYSFQTSISDTHPNTAGETAIAMIVHDKMIKLGYLDDDYILDDPSDL